MAPNARPIEALQAMKPACRLAAVARMLMRRSSAKSYRGTRHAIASDLGIADRSLTNYLTDLGHLGFVIEEERVGEFVVLRVRGDFTHEGIVRNEARALVDILKRSAPVALPDVRARLGCTSDEMPETIALASSMSDRPIVKRSQPAVLDFAPQAQVDARSRAERQILDAIDESPESSINWSLLSPYWNGNSEKRERENTKALRRLARDEVIVEIGDGVFARPELARRAF